MNILEHIYDRSLAHITRFSTRPQVSRESVADHSFFVAYITSLLCKLLKKEGEAIDSEKAVAMALIHDMEERFSGDILGPFKHHSKEVSEAIRGVNVSLINEVFGGLPDDVQESYISLWREENKQESREAHVVKLADRLSLLSKCKEEIEVGNQFFKEIYEREYQKIAEDDRPWMQKLKPYITEQ